jgi:histidine phosphotransferase ChpT
MNDQDTTLLTELIASKICHDLTSPVGAVANGVEIMEEVGADDDVISLIAFSAAQAGAKLKALRMAYGLGGADDSIKLELIHQTYGEYVEGDNRIKQDWDPHMDLSFEKRRGFPKLLLCSLMLAGDALPKGGVICMKAEGDNTLLITAEGTNASLRQNVLKTLEHKTSVEYLDPTLIHPYITKLFAIKYNYEITIDDDTENFIFLRLKQAIVS